MAAAGERGTGHGPGPAAPSSPGADACPCVPQVFKAYQTAGFVLVRVLVPAWVICYYLKYHVMVRAARGHGGGRG